VAFIHGSGEMSRLKPGRVLGPSRIDITPFRRIVTWAGMSGALLFASGSFGTASAAPAARSPSTTARALAVAVTKAATPAERHHAVLNVMQALGIGVYTLQTRAMVRGAERTPHDFYLYDFEARNLAYALGARQRFGLVPVARALASSGLGTGRRAGIVDPFKLLAAVRTAARNATSHSSRPASLAMLIDRELGLMHSPSQDIASASLPHALLLDPLQTALIVADIAIPVFEHSSVHRTRSARNAASLHSIPHCYDDMTGTTKSIWKAGLIGLGHVPISAQLMDLWHAGLIDTALDFKELSAGETKDTAYGPPGTPGFTEPYYPGVPLKLRVKVTLAAKTWDENSVKCGALAGYTFPTGKVGSGVPDIPINWKPLLTPGDYDQLLQHGKLSFEPAAGPDGQTKTGSDGIAGLILSPKDEGVPGLGQLITDIGVVQPSAELAGPFGNSTAGRVESFIPRFATIGWSIQHHDQNGTLEIVSKQSETFNISSSFETETGNAQWDLKSRLPIENGSGGSASLTWTHLHYHIVDTYPNNNGQCTKPGDKAVETDDGSSPRPGALEITGITGFPNVSVTVGLTDAGYHIRRVSTSDSGCGNFTNDSPVPFDGAIPAAGGPPFTPNVVHITGWTAGAPGSGIFASKQVKVWDGSIKLEIVPKTD
jgi:hypothetical protein